MPSWGAGCFGSFKKSGESFYNKHCNLDLSLEEKTLTLPIARKGKCFVELEKKDGFGFGLIISGGIDKNSIPKVAHLKPDSIAYRSDALSVGDHVVSINGIYTSKLKQEEIAVLLKNAGNKVVLEIEYEIPSPSENVTPSITKIIQVKLEKEKDSFGFTLREDFSSDIQNTKSFTITHVRFGSPAYRSGIIKAGDRLLAIDGINLASVSLHDALFIMNQLKENALFTIEYSVSQIDAVKNAIGPLLIEIDKAPACFLGINLSCHSRPEHAIIIESIRQASVAERCGALHVGDHILAINDTKINSMSLVEVMQLLKASSGKVMRLEVLPFSQAAIRLAPEIYSNKSFSKFSSNSDFVSITHPDRTEVVLYANHNGFGFSLESSTDVLATPYISSIDYGSPAETSGLLQYGDRILAVNGEITTSLLLDEVMNMIEKSHPCVVLVIEFDVTEAALSSNGTIMVELPKSSASLGLLVSAPENRLIGEPLIIADVRKGSVSHRTGLIQPGDELIAINSLRTGNCTVEEASAALFSFADSVKLYIRKRESFQDDSDSTYGLVYTVQLERHGGPLGITISGTKDPFDPIFISGITEKGLAERTGALHVGDRILAINDNNLQNKTLNEAICILKTCGDIVTLKILKCQTLENYSNSTDVATSHISSSYKDHYELYCKQEGRRFDGNNLMSVKDNEVWNNVLENLQTGGHVSSIHEVEQTIWPVDKNINSSSEYQASVLENTLLQLNSNIEQFDVKNDFTRSSFRHSMCMDSACDPLPIEIHKVTLFKDQIYEDFGFSLSDSENKNGVYINNIRPGGPADQSGLIKPLDRILQVNNVRTSNAGLIVPLIASSGDRLELIISRPAYDSISSSRSTLGRLSFCNNWAEEERKGYFQETRTYTKTL